MSNEILTFRPQSGKIVGIFSIFLGKDLSESTIFLDAHSKFFPNFSGGTPNFVSLIFACTFRKNDQNLVTKNNNEGWDISPDYWFEKLDLFLDSLDKIIWAIDLDVIGPPPHYDVPVNYKPPRSSSYYFSSMQWNIESALRFHCHRTTSILRHFLVSLHIVQPFIALFMYHNEM